MFPFTFTSLPTRFYHLLRSLAGANVESDPSPIDEEIGTTLPTSPSSTSLEATYYTDDEFEESTSSPPSQGLRRLHRHSKSPKPLNPTTRKQAKVISSSSSKSSQRRIQSSVNDTSNPSYATSTNVSHPVKGDRRREKRARRDSGASDSDDVWFECPPSTNGLYGSPNLLPTDIAEYSYSTAQTHYPATNIPSSSTSPVVFSQPPLSTWVPLAPPLDNGVGIAGTHAQGPEKKRKRSPGKRAASTHPATSSKTSTILPGDASRSTTTTRHPIGHCSTANLEPETSPILPPSLATTSSPPRTPNHLNDNQSSSAFENDTDPNSTFLQNAVQMFTGQRYYVVSTSQGSEEWINLLNQDGIVHTCCRSDSPTVKLIKYLVDHRGLQIEQIDVPEMSGVKGSPVPSDTRDGPSTTDRSDSEHLSSLDNDSELASIPAASQKSRMARWNPLITVSDELHAPPAIKEDLIEARVPAPESHSNDADDRVLLGADTTTDASLGQGESPDNLTLDVSSVPVSASASSSLQESLVAEHASGSALEKNEVDNDDGPGSVNEKLVHVSQPTSFTSYTRPPPVKHTVYSQYHALSSQVVAVNAWYKQGASLIAARVQLHRSTAENGLPWLHVISQNGGSLIDSVRVHPNAAINDDAEDVVIFRVFAVDEKLSWQPRYFSVNRGPNAIRLAKSLNVVVPPLTHASSTLPHNNDTEASTSHFSGSQNSNGTRLLMESEPASTDHTTGPSPSPSTLATIVQAPTSEAPMDAEATQMNDWTGGNAADTEIIQEELSADTAPSSHMQPSTAYSDPAHIIHYDDVEMMGSVTITGSTHTFVTNTETVASELEQDEAMNNAAEEDVGMHPELPVAMLEDSIMEGQVPSSADATVGSQESVNMTIDAGDSNTVPLEAGMDLASSISQPIVVATTQTTNEATPSADTSVDITFAFQTLGLGGSKTMMDASTALISRTTAATSTPEATPGPSTGPSPPTSDPRLRDPRVLAERIRLAAMPALLPPSPTASAASSTHSAIAIPLPAVALPYDSSLTHERGTEGIRALAANMEAMFMTATPSWAHDDDDDATTNGITANAFGKMTATFSIAGSSSYNNAAVTEPGLVLSEPSTVKNEDDREETGDDSETAVAQGLGDEEVFVVAEEEDEQGGEDQQQQQHFTAEEIAALKLAIWGSEDGSDEED
ncbi:hypothetical protein FRB97_005955 [Tulasnella sp. 331]|nr:hypothetical protein FRB97_005955 [Tulasnella sp. 331]